MADEKSSKGSREDLLKDLESIEALLDKHERLVAQRREQLSPSNESAPGSQAQDQPLPSMTTTSGEPPLLDIDTIFDEHTDTPTGESTAPANERPKPTSETPPEPPLLARSVVNREPAAARFELELLVQEVVDELLPLAEASLRDRLANFSREEIFALAEDLKNKKPAT